MFALGLFATVQAATTTPSISDSNGNTWTTILVKTLTGTALSVILASAPIAVAGTLSVTLTQTGGTGGTGISALSIFEVKGAFGVIASSFCDPNSGGFLTQFPSGFSTQAGTIVISGFVTNAATSITMSFTGNSMQSQTPNDFACILGNSSGVYNENLNATTAGCSAHIG